MAITGLTGCKEETPSAPEKLSAPVVTLTDDVATWNANPNADKFEISVGGKLSYVENDYTSEKLADGVSFKVRAIGDGTKYETSDWSNSVTYTAPHVCDFSGEWKSDATHHWHECSCGETDTKVEHSGGTATTTEKAKCSVCNTPYGELLEEEIVPVVSIADFNSNFDSYTESAQNVQLTGVIYAGDAYGLYITDNSGNTVYVKFDYSSLSLSVGQQITAIGSANLYYSLPQLLATEVTAGDSVGCDLTIYAGTIAQIISANSDQAAKVFNHGVYRATGVLTKDGSNYFLVDGTDKLQIKASTYAGDFNKLIAYEGKKISVNVVISDCFTTTGIFRVSPLSDVDADIEEFITIANFNSNFDSYVTSGNKVNLTGIIYAGDAYGLYLTDNNGNTVYVKFDYSSLSLSMGQQITVIGSANLYYSLPQLLATNITMGDSVGCDLTIYAGTIAQIISANSDQAAKVFNHNVYRTTGVLTKDGSNYFLVDGTDKLQIKSSTFADDFNNLISYEGKRIKVTVVLSDCFTTTGIFRVSPLPAENADIEEFVSIADFNNKFDAYVASAENVKLTGVIYAADAYGVYIADSKNDTVYIKCDYSSLSLSVGQEITVIGNANLYYSLPQLIAVTVTPGEIVESNFPIYAASITGIINANTNQAAKVFNHGVYRATGVLTKDGDNYFLVDGTDKLQIKASTFADDFNSLIAYEGKKISVNVVISDCFTTTGIFRVSPLTGASANITEVAEDSATVLSIADFNSSFDVYEASGDKVQLTGIIYAGDAYGLYLTDNNGNTVYVKFDYSSLSLSVGQEITVIGSASLYYSLPQLLATEVTTGDLVGYDITIYAGTIAQIISANSDQAAKVFNHGVYRATGVLTNDGSNYFLVDGADKLQIKASTYADDFNNLIAYEGKKISVNIVISDCFTTTGIFRVSPLAGTDAAIEEITEEPDENTTDINFVMINDTHGAFTDSAEGYSIGRVDTLVEDLEESKGDYIFIHNGDAFQGSYVCGETYGLVMIEALNASGVDCFVIGNHEFDWGIDKIAAYADGDLSNGEANFPFLGANIYYKDTTTRPDWIKAYTVIEQDGIKVGIIGIMGEDQESDILTRYVKDYDFVNPIGIIESTAAYLRGTEGCDVVVVATHDYTPTVNTAIASLSGSSRIDAIFCAHTHQNISTTVTRSDNVVIPVVQCNHKNVNAQEVIISLTEDKQYNSFSATKYYPSNYAISDDVQALITKYKALIDESNEVIGTTANAFSKSTLGAFAVDQMLNYEYSGYNFGDIDIAIMNTGGIRATIDDGDITRAEVFEVFPFNNSVVLVNISGKLIKELYGSNSTYLYMDIDSAIGDYNLLDDDTIYQLAVIDFVFENERYTQFDGLTEEDYIQTDCVLRDMLMVYLDASY